MENTEDYRKRINIISENILNEPFIKKMRQDISEGIEKTGIRQAELEDQFVDIQQQSTEKDIDSSTEIINARNGEQVLNDRLNKEKIEVSAVEPINSEIWYQDTGERPLDFDSSTSISLQNAEVSDDPPTDTQKLWFEQE